MRYILICLLFLSCTKQVVVTPVHNDAAEAYSVIGDMCICGGSGISSSSEFTWESKPQIKLSIWLGSILYDGFTIDFDSSYCDCVDEMDAQKIPNFNDVNFGISKDNIFLAWERRPYISKDSTFIKMTHMQAATYQIKISSTGFTGNAGFYIYDATKGKKSIKVNSDTTVDMVIPQAGTVENRFKIIYK